MKAYRKGQDIYVLAESDDERILLSGINATWQDDKYCFLKYTEEHLKWLTRIGAELDEALTAFAFPKCDWKDTPPLYVESKRPQLEHQAQAIRLLMEQRRFMLNHDPGTGKSKTMIDAFMELKRRGEVDRAVVITDNSMVLTWVLNLIPEDCDELAMPLIGSASDRMGALNYGVAKNASFYVINWDGLRAMQLGLELIMNARTVLIFDESQRMKDWRTARFKQAIDLVDTYRPKYIWLATGTPITQSPEDIFTQFMCIDRSIFGDLHNMIGFQATYFSKDRAGRIVNLKNMGLFMEKFNSKSHRVRKEECRNLPAKVYQPVYFELPEPLKTTYKRFVNQQGLLAIAGHPKATNGVLYAASHPFSVLAKSRQIVHNYIYLMSATGTFGAAPNPEGEPLDVVVDPEPSFKQLAAGQVMDDVLQQLFAEAADQFDKEVEAEESIIMNEVITLYEKCANPKIEFIEQQILDHDKPMVIWFTFSADKYAIEAVLKKHNVAYAVIEGATPIATRHDIIRLFQDEKLRVILGQPASASTGITLTRCQTVIYYNNSYSVERRLQSEDRCHRLGSEAYGDSVIYYDLIYKGTIEQSIYRLLKKRIQLTHAIINKENLDSLLLGEFDG